MNRFLPICFCFVTRPTLVCLSVREHKSTLLSINSSSRYLGILLYISNMDFEGMVDSILY